MKYKAYLKQDGEGCDYTIGCGQIVVEINASNIDEAKQTLTELISENYSQSDERIVSCDLYEINEVFTIDVGGIYSHKEILEEEQKQKQTLEEDKKEFERLKAKLSS